MTQQQRPPLKLVAGVLLATVGVLAVVAGFLRYYDAIVNQLSAAFYGAGSSSSSSSSSSSYANASLLHTNPNGRNWAVPPEEQVRAEHFASFHNTTLTHAIYSIYTLEDAREVEAAITNTWEAVPPCDNWAVLARCNDTAVFPQDVRTRPQLVLLMHHTVSSSSSAIRQRLERVLAQSRAVRQCFRDASVVEVVKREKSEEEEEWALDELLLTDDGLDCLGGGSELGYGLFLSPSTRPVRANWLTTVAHSVLFPVPAYWAITPLPRSFPRLPTSEEWWGSSSLSAALGVFRLSRHPTRNSPLVKKKKSAVCQQPSTAAVSTAHPDTLAYVYLHELRPFARHTLRLALHNVSYTSTPTSSEVLRLPRPVGLLVHLHYYLYYGLRPKFEVVRFQLAHRVMVSRLLVETEQQEEEDTLYAVLVSVGATTTRPNTPKEDLPSYHHTSHVSHVVVAFNSVPTQFARLRKTMQVWWNSFPPCRSPRAEQVLLHQWSSHCDASSPPPALPQLVIMATRRSMFELPSEADRLDAELERAIARDMLPAIPSSSKPCFRGFSICIVRLTPRTDAYLVGSRILFERFLRGDCTVGTAEHVVYIEPDSRPVQPGWLSALASQVVFPNPESYLLGSIFHGEERQTKWTPPLGYLFHFNGNAIYQIKKQKQHSFPDYYFSRVRPHMHQLLGVDGQSAMDIDVTTYATSTFDGQWNEPYLLPAEQRRQEYLGKLYYDSVLREMPPLKLPQGYGGAQEEERDRARAYFEFVTLSRYTTLIVNKYKSAWRRQDLPPQVQLVHGGYCGVECK